MHLVIRFGCLSVFPFLTIHESSVPLENILKLIIEFCGQLLLLLVYIYRLLIEFPEGTYHLKVINVNKAFSEASVLELISNRIDSVGHLLLRIKLFTFLLWLNGVSNQIITKYVLIV